MVEERSRSAQRRLAARGVEAHVGGAEALGSGRTLARREKEGRERVTISVVGGSLACCCVLCIGAGCEPSVRGRPDGGPPSEASLFDGTTDVQDASGDARTVDALITGDATPPMHDARPPAPCSPVPGVTILESVRPGDERLRQRRVLANGVYAIELVGAPGWREGPDRHESSYFRFEGQNPLILDRTIAFSRCPGDTTVDDDTPTALDGDLAAFGGYAFFYALPPDAAPVPERRAGSETTGTGLPGLADSTTWYINISQVRCEETPGTPAESCGLIYDVIP